MPSSVIAENIFVWLIRIRDIWLDKVGKTDVFVIIHFCIIITTYNIQIEIWKPRGGILPLWSAGGNRRLHFMFDLIVSGGDTEAVTSMLADPAADTYNPASPIWCTTQMAHKLAQERQFKSIILNSSDQLSPRFSKNDSFGPNPIRKPNFVKPIILLPVSSAKLFLNYDTQNNTKLDPNQSIK